MLTVNGDRGVVERQLAGGELAWPSCGGVLGGWGHGAGAAGPGSGRGRCRAGASAQVTVPGVRGTHGVLPVWCLLRRADAAAVIGAALVAAASGAGFRVIARTAGEAAGDGAGVAAPVRVPGRGGAGVLHGAAGPDQPGSGDAAGTAGRVAAAVAAVAGAAAAVAQRWPLAGQVPVWAAASAASGGLLLAPGWPPAPGATRADPLRGAAAATGWCPGHY